MPLQRPVPVPPQQGSEPSAVKPPAALLPTASSAGLSAPPREAKPWSAEEDELIIEMHRQRARGGDPPTHTYQTIAMATGRSANAVKCRWQNKLKAEVLGSLNSA